MAREWGDYDGDYDARAMAYQNFWYSWAKRSRDGKKGQKILKELEQILLNMEDKRLSEGFAVEPEWDKQNNTIFPLKPDEEGLTCLLGNYILNKHPDKQERIREEFIDLALDAPSSMSSAVELVTDYTDIPRTFASMLMEENDDSPRLYDIKTKNPVRETPEQRYERVLNWVQSQIKPIDKEAEVMV